MLRRRLSQRGRGDTWLPCLLMSRCRGCRRCRHLRRRGVIPRSRDHTLREGWAWVFHSTSVFSFFPIYGHLNHLFRVPGLYFSLLYDQLPLDQLSSFFLVYINRSDYPAVTVTVILLCPCRIWAAYKHSYYYYYYYYVFSMGRIVFSGSKLVDPWGTSRGRPRGTSRGAREAIVTTSPNLGNKNKLTTNQNSLFRSRDWFSANQGPVFHVLLHPVWPSHGNGKNLVHHSFLQWVCSQTPSSLVPGSSTSCGTWLSCNPGRSKQPIRTRYLGHVTGYISQSGSIT
eukprot:sb/3467801/